MIFYPHFKFASNSRFVPSRLVFQHRGADADAAAGGADARQAALDQRFAALEGGEFPEDVRRMAQDALRSKSDAQHNLVDRLALGRGEGGINPEQFRSEYEELVQQEKSWQKIFDTQRGIRQKIRDLQERAESYMELLPRKRPVFSSLVREASQLNQNDLTLDRELKGSLGPLAAPLEREGQPELPALLTGNEARAIFELDTTEPDFEQKLEKLLQPLKNPRVPERRQEAEQALRAVRRAKQRERTVERRFFIVTRQLSKIIELNVSRARNEAEKKRMIKNAEKFIGIRLKPGVIIRHSDLSEGSPGTLSIQNVKFDVIPIKDHKGKVIGKALSPPAIHLSDGRKLSLARFRKWVDAANAYEDVSSLNGVEDLIGFKTLGIPLRKDLQLEYQRFTKDREGKIQRSPHYVRIIEIKDNRIYFNEPVMYQAGLGMSGEAQDEELRESLSFGEFVKWYHRQEVEESFTLVSVREKLRIWNREYNKEFGISAKDNPPITLFLDEELYYPGESLYPFRVQSVSSERVSLSNGESFTLAQFFNFVRRNHVQRVSEKEKRPEDIEKEKKDRAVLEQEKESQTQAREKHAKEVEEAKAKGPPGEPAGIFNFLKQAWHSTTLLSAKDLGSMIVSIKEFIERRHKRQSQGRYGAVGSKLPGMLGTEFYRVLHASENEEVNLNKESMTDWGVFSVLDRLSSTNNRDVAKACIITLVEKGEMRWDDEKLWATMNRLTSRYTVRGAELYIPEDKEYLAKVGKSGEDMIGPACDAIWGTGTFAEWFQKNVSTYNNNKNNFEYKGKQLEADPKGTGGLRKEFTRLLNMWRAGEYVNPHEYEEMIDFAIKFGKASMEDKVFYLIMGMITENPNGYGTLLHLDRASDINGKYLNQFPILDFYTNKGALRPDGTVGPWREKDYKDMANQWFPDDFREGEPGMQFSKFLWHFVMFDKNYRTRLSKGLRNAEQMDHDDAPYFIPPSSYTEIDAITGSPGGGEKKFFTPEGYANAYSGFSQYFIALANSKIIASDPERQRQNLRDSLKSFVWYDAIIDNRFRKFDGAKRARLSEHHFNRRSVTDDTVNLAVHRDQLRSFISEVGQEYGMDFSYIFEKTGSVQDRREAERQRIVEKNIENFVNVVDDLFKRDNGQGVLRVIQRVKDRDASAKNGLRGMRGWTLRRDQPFVATKAGENRAKEMGLL